MKVSGSHTLAAPRDEVFDALLDPAILARTLPGCQQMEVTGKDRYSVTVNAGVASIKGTYTGSVTLLDAVSPESYRMKAEGSGGPGTVSADATVRLEVDGESTVVHYDADAVVGGMIGGVGQRMLQGVAKKTAGEFFGNVEQAISGAPMAQPVEEPEAADVGAGPAATPGERQVGQVFAGTSAAPAAGSGAGSTDLLIAALVGAGIALVGVLVGRRSAR
jgi:carbon monoxide dehydrogenase subunit G